ncbi:MAG: diguanylate cyclase [Candidatus Aminicenantes bacterium]|nr:diguanylate cyclase [Candidatus Aminicenantes bacterium]
MEDKTVQDSKKLKRKGLLNKKYNIIITVIKGEDIDFGKMINFNKKIIKIGRAKSNDIVLHDQKVSKEHCEIRITLSDELLIDEIILKDLFSTNGTCLNDEYIEQKILRFGDKIQVGSTVLLFKSTDEVEETYHSKLFNIATTDPLTGLLNRRSILNELEIQNIIAKTNDRKYSILILDIDDFKKINDNFGHLIGDKYLKYFCEHMNGCLRKQDKSGRIGGEEFLIILSETEIEGAEALAEKIRGTIEELTILKGKAKIKATVSIGIVQFGLHSEETSKLLDLADTALYQAKNSGKNKVEKAIIIEDCGDTVKLP